MWSLGCQWRTTARASATGAGGPILTRTTAVVITATGAAECIAMHSEQWSASWSSGCMCATWTTASSASRARHRKAAAPKARGSRRRLSRKSVCNPVNKSSSASRIHSIGRISSGWDSNSCTALGANHPPSVTRLLRLDCCAMPCFRPTRLKLLALVLAIASSCAAQSQTQPQPLPFQPGQPVAAVNHRLILKDGSYQVVRRYEIVGDRVRYISVERAGDWEELPLELVDWEATRKWERDLATAPVQEPTLTMKEAEDLDKEDAAEREEQRARRPEVAKGLALPDVGAVFALDTFEGAPKLVELVPVDLAVNGKFKLGLRTLNPLSGARASLELDGAHAKVHLHVGVPVLYLAHDTSDAERDSAETDISPAPAAKSGGANAAASRKHATHTPASGYALVRVEEREKKRILGAIHVSLTRSVTQDENVIPARSEVLPGKHWLKITPEKPLATGEYALIEIISASEISQSVWDFRVDPQSGDNEGSIGPIVK